MKDRYLYRGKRIDNGEWVEGHLICSFTGIHYIVKSFDHIKNQIEIYEIDRSTVCQCTGLKDKNGNLIWENDVVKCIDKNNDIEFTAIIEFGNPNGFYNWGYQLRHIKGDEPNLDILLWIGMEETGATCEIVGNVFDGGFNGKSSKEN